MRSWSFAFSTHWGFVWVRAWSQQWFVSQNCHCSSLIVIRFCFERCRRWAYWSGASGRCKLFLAAGRCSFVLWVLGWLGGRYFGCRELLRWYAWHCVKKFTSMWVYRNFCTQWASWSSSNFGTAPNIIGTGWWVLLQSFNLYFLWFWLLIFVLISLFLSKS